MQQFDRRVVLGAAGLAGMAALSKLAHAGPLDPPAGPVTGTGKPLADLEPRIAVNGTNTPGSGAALYRIAQWGSYYLTGDIDAQSGTAIEIAANHVVLDLCGFSIRSVARDIVITGSRSVTIRNGCIAAHVGVPALGVSLDGSCEGVVLEDLVFSSLHAGLTYFLQAPRAVTVRRCVFHGLSGLALLLSGAMVSDCTVEACDSGLDVGPGSLIERCRVLGCAAFGVRTGANSRVAGCVISGSGGTGLTAGHSCSIESCDVSECGGVGIDGQTGLRVIGSRVRANVVGGIRGIHACRVRDAHVHGNGFWGIDLFDHAHVEQSQVSDNAHGGIRVSSFSRVAGNSVDYHPGTGACGIRTAAGSGGCQILDNQVSRAPTGVFLDGGWHLVARNTLASLGTAIVNMGANNNSGVLVAGAGAVAGMTNPSANIYY